MPRRFRLRRRRYRRRFIGYSNTRGRVYSYSRKRFRRRDRVVKIPRSRGVIPAGTVCRLKYAANFVLTANLGVLNIHKFRLNGLYDPDQTGTGHQPMGFDQISLRYYKYRVYRVRWIVQFQAPTGTNACQVHVIPVNATTTPSYDDIQESPFAITKYMSNADGNRAVTTIKGGMHLAKLNGVTKKFYYADENYEGSGGGSPADPAEANYLNIGINQPNATTTSVNVNVLLLYDSYWYEPIPLTGS